MFPLNLNLVRKFTVSGAQWKVNKSSGLPEMLLKGTIQGGYTKIISDTSFICSCGLFGYFITPPCNDPVRLFLLSLFGYVTGYQILNTFYPRKWFSFLHYRGLKL
jgi:hypothetical protein